MQTNYATQSATLQAAADDVRVEELQGREHVVAPVTLVREMVLKGELLPFEEIQRTQLAWNGKPGTISHPKNQDGEFLPASAPSQFESHVAATLFDVDTSSANRALEGEIWIDRERSAAVADALDRDDPAELLEDGETVEVSIGYWYNRHDFEGEFEGDEYDGVQHNVQPDHLALLPNATGECSVEDGCGAGRADPAGTAMTAPPLASYSAVEDDVDGDGSPGLGWLQNGLQRLGFGGQCGDCGGACNDPGESSSTNDNDDDPDPDSDMNDRTQKLAEQSAFDAETLSEWDDDQLDALEESLDASTDDPGDGTGAGDDPDNEVLERIEELQEEQQALREQLNQQDEERRTELVAQIQANSSLEEEQLPEDVDALEALANEVAPSAGVYAGVSGGASAQAASGGEDFQIGVGDRYLEEDN